MNLDDRAHDLTASDVLRRYKDEDLPDFLEIELEDVNQRGNSGDCPLHVACTRGIFEEVKALVDAGADINARGDMGGTPLHAAAASERIGGRRTASSRGDPRIVELLLAHGASVDAIDEFGTTPLDVAVRHRRDEVVKLLQEWFEHNKHSGPDADPVKAG